MLFDNMLGLIMNHSMLGLICEYDNMLLSTYVLKLEILVNTKQII